MLLTINSYTVYVPCTLFIAYSQFHIFITYLHLKFKISIESFIVKLEQSFELKVGAQRSYISIRNRKRSPRKLVYVLSIRFSIEKILN